MSKLCRFCLILFPFPVSPAVLKRRTAADVPEHGTEIGCGIEFQNPGNIFHRAVCFQKNSPCFFDPEIHHIPCRRYLVVFCPVTEKSASGKSVELYQLIKRKVIAVMKMEIRDDSVHVCLIEEGGIFLHFPEQDQFLNQLHAFQIDLIRKSEEHGIIHHLLQRIYQIGDYRRKFNIP